MSAVFKILFTTTKKLHQDCCFDILVSKDTRSDALAQQFYNVDSGGERLDVSDVGIGNQGFLSNANPFNAIRQQKSSLNKKITLQLKLE